MIFVVIILIDKKNRGLGHYNVVNIFMRCYSAYYVLQELVYHDHKVLR